MFALDLPVGWGTAAFSIMAVVLVLMLSLLVWASRYTKVGPNQVLVVSGRKHTVAEPDGTIVERGFRIVSCTPGSVLNEVVPFMPLTSVVERVLRDYPQETAGGVKHSSRFAS